MEKRIPWHEATQYFRKMLSLKCTLILLYQVYFPLLVRVVYTTPVTVSWLILVTPALPLNTILLINAVARVTLCHYRSVQQRAKAKRCFVQEDTKQILDGRQTNLNVLVALDVCVALSAQVPEPSVCLVFTDLLVLTWLPLLFTWYSSLCIIVVLRESHIWALKHLSKLWNISSWGNSGKWIHLVLMPPRLN